MFDIIYWVIVNFVEIWDLLSGVSEFLFLCFILMSDSSEIRRRYLCVAPLLKIWEFHENRGSEGSTFPTVVHEITLKWVPSYLESKEPLGKVCNTSWSAPPVILFSSTFGLIYGWNTPNAVRSDDKPVSSVLFILLISWAETVQLMCIWTNLVLKNLERFSD